MSYRFAGVIGLWINDDFCRPSHEAMDAVRAAVGGVTRLEPFPIDCWVHAIAVDYDRCQFEDWERDALLRISRAFPDQRFAAISVDCFGGLCEQAGFLFGAGEVLADHAFAEASDADSVLMKLCDGLGASIPDNYFPAFERGRFRFDDAAWMSRALAHARSQSGRTAPNPAVGCLIRGADGVLGRGATGEGGRPHAEEIALEDAGDMDGDAATAYVTLEPCATRSSGAPSCADRLIASGVKRVVVACPDPHPNGSGGVDRLRAAGIDVEVGVLQAEAEALNAGFFHRVRSGRPLVVVGETGWGCDAEFSLGPRETFEQALDRMGREGLNTVFVRAGSPLVPALDSRGLLFREE